MALLGLALGALPACPEEPCTVEVEFLLADGASRPEHLALAWQLPGGQARSERFPESGGLPEQGERLGSLTRSWPAHEWPGDRQLGVVGFVGEMRVVQAAGTVRWAPGETVRLALTLAGASPMSAPPTTGMGGMGGMGGSLGAGGAGGGGMGGAFGGAGGQAGAGGAMGGTGGAPDAAGGPGGSGGSGGMLADAGGGQDPDGGPSADPEPAVGNGPLLLYWPFDEADGEDIEDRSGRGRAGQLAGNRGGPQRSTDVPGVRFDNARSLVFERARRTRVDGPVADSAFKLQALTVSFWYRANDLDDEPMTVLRLGQTFRVRIDQSAILLDKRVRSGVTGCRLAAPDALDGDWHHVAVVFTADGMAVHLDGGAQAAACRDEGAIAYETAPVLLLGRGEGGRASDFEGTLDDVRIYGRALERAEIARLAAGLP